MSITKAMQDAASHVVLGIEIGRRAFRSGKPRSDMKSEVERIGWDDAAYLVKHEIQEKDQGAKCPRCGLPQSACDFQRDIADPEPFL